MIIHIIPQCPGYKLTPHITVLLKPRSGPSIAIPQDVHSTFFGLYRQVRSLDVANHQPCGMGRLVTQDPTEFYCW